MTRRQCLIAGLGLPLVWPDWSHALTRQALQFPRDFGSHPSYAIEWWYVTGQLQSGQRQFGFQLTFFRSRINATQAMASNFAAKQLIFAHAAVTDVAEKRLWHDQRIARTSGHGQVDLAFASEVDTDVRIGNWSLKRQDRGYQARAIGQDFSFDLTLRSTQTVLLQGDQGLSRKGPEARQASFYYSQPQLLAQGELTLGGQTLPVSGLGWLDHEWSQSLLHPQAVGWDWIGMNLLDGSTLTAFQLRTRSGEALWAGGSVRVAGQTQAENLTPDQVRFTPIRRWTSLNSGVSYPVQWSVEITRNNSSTGQPERYTVNALVDNQELDSRQSTGAIYWEGLSELFDRNNQLLGRGYLEMTGYGSPLRL
jgi:predicted secreted hydrolase